MSFVPRAKLKDSIDCEKSLSDKDLAMAFYASSEEFKSFIKCYNQQYSYVKKTIGFKKTPVKYEYKVRPNPLTDFRKEKAFISLFRKIIDEKFEFQKFYSYKKAIQTHNHILARLAESFLFIKLGNMSRAKKVLLDITTHDMSYHLFQENIPRLTIETQIDLFKEVLKEIGLYFEGQTEFRNLIYYLSAHTSGRFSEMLDEEFDTSRKLSKMRTYYASYSFGKPYPFVWGPIIFEISSRTEYKKAIGIGAGKKGPEDREELLLYRGLDAIPRSAKKKTLDYFENLQKSSQLYDRYLTIVLLEDEKFFEFLSANKVKQKKILAAIKRDYYRDLLKKNYHKSLAVFELLNLGDWEQEFIVELIKYENYKL